jgi:hypothetical protein
MIRALVGALVIALRTDSSSAGQVLTANQAISNVTAKLTSASVAATEGGGTASPAAPLSAEEVQHVKNVLTQVTASKPIAHTPQPPPAPKIFGRDPRPAPAMQHPGPTNATSTTEATGVKSPLPPAGVKPVMPPFRGAGAIPGSVGGRPGQPRPPVAVTPPAAKPATEPGGASNPVTTGSGVVVEPASVGSQGSAVAGGTTGAISGAGAGVVSDPPPAPPEAASAPAPAETPAPATEPAAAPVSEGAPGNPPATAGV